MTSTPAIFKYPGRAHKRKHGPSGYVKYESYKPWLRDEFLFKCVYCLDRETWNGPVGRNVFSTDHFEPVSISPGLTLDYENLLYACLRCNSAKRDLSLPLNPCVNAMGRHLTIDGLGHMIGITKAGKEFVLQLGLDDPDLAPYRLQQVRLAKLLSQSQAPDAPDLLKSLFGFPRVLPDLQSLKPPGGNAKPEGARQCSFRLQKLGRLSWIY